MNCNRLKHIVDADATHLNCIELSRVGGVNAPVGSRDPVYNFLCCSAIEVGDNLTIRHNDVVVETVSNIDQNSGTQTSIWSLFGQFPNGRPNPSAVVVS